MVIQDTVAGRILCLEMGFIENPALAVVRHYVLCPGGPLHCDTASLRGPVGDEAIPLDMFTLALLWALDYNTRNDSK